MSIQQSIWKVILAGAVGLAACAAPSPTPDVMMEKSPEAMLDKTAEPTAAVMLDETAAVMPSATTEAMMEATAAAMPEVTPTTGAAAMMGPAWLKTPLTNAVTRETFALADWHGKVVLVETMAVWCPKCLQQQKEVKALHETLGVRDDFVSVGLGVDPNEDSNLLGAYVVTNGFNWPYAVAPAEVAREIAQLYGDQFLNPPSTPMLIVDRAGEVHVLPFGIKDAEALLAALEPFLSEGM
jgi:hypothetical protein